MQHQAIYHLIGANQRGLKEPLDSMPKGGCTIGRWSSTSSGMQLYQQVLKNKEKRHLAFQSTGPPLTF